MKSKTLHVDGEGENPQFEVCSWEDEWKTWDVRKTSINKKDIQFQIDKPKQRETPMKSQTRHIDGGGGNTRVHMEIRRTNEICEKSQIPIRHTHPNR